MTTTRKLAALLAAIALASCDTPTSTRPVPAFDPTVLTNGLHYRWPSGMHVRVAIATANLPPTTDLSGALDRAMAAWNSVPQFAEFVLERATNASEAEVLLYDQVTTLPVQSAACPFDPRGASGYTYFCPSRLGSATSSAQPDSALRLPLLSGGGSVVVVIRVDRGRLTSSTAYDAVVAHELGHALGIGAHSDRAEDLMYGAPTVTMPSARDKATLRAVLGMTADIRL